LRFGLVGEEGVAALGAVGLAFDALGANVQRAGDIAAVEQAAGDVRHELVPAVAIQEAGGTDAPAVFAGEGANSRIRPNPRKNSLARASG